MSPNVSYCRSENDGWHLRFDDSWRRESIRGLDDAECHFLPWVRLSMTLSVYSNPLWYLLYGNNNQRLVTWLTENSCFCYQ